jgi:hypothetical protein
MATLLTKALLVKFLGSVHPDSSIDDDCVTAILQMATPYNDVFANKSKDECIHLINTYFDARLAAFTISQIDHPVFAEKVPPRDIIMECLISELLEITGNTTKDRVGEEYAKTHTYGEQDNDGEINYVLTVYDLYRGLINSESKPMFVAYLIPDWIITGKFPKEYDTTKTWLTLEEITKFCEGFTLTPHTYEDKVIECIYNLLTGCALIYLTMSDDVITPFTVQLPASPWLDYKNHIG